MLRTNFKQYNTSFDQKCKIEISKLAPLFKQFLQPPALLEKKEMVLFIGPSSSGKSALINRMFGMQHIEKLYANTFDNHKIYFNKVDNFLYCDCPDYNATYSNAEDLCTSIGLPLILKQSAFIKAIIVVIDWAIVQVKRAEYLDEVFKQIEYIARTEAGDFNEYDLSNSIFFVFTQTNLLLTREKVLDVLYSMLKNGDPKKTSGELQGLLNKQKSLRKCLLNTLDNTSEQIALIKEIESLEQIIVKIRGKMRMLLLLINNPTHIFVQHASSKIDELRALLTTSIPIPVDKLLLLNYTNPIIEKIGKEAIELLNDKEDITQQLQQYKNKITELNTQIEHCNNEIAFLKGEKNNGISVVEQKQRALNKAKERIEALQKCKELIQEELEFLLKQQVKLEIEISALDTDESILYVKECARSKPQLRLNSIEDGQEANTTLESNKYFLTSHGMYPIGYYAKDNNTGGVKFKIFAKKRKIHKVKIMALKQSLDVVMQKIEDANRDLSALAANISQWQECTEQLQQDNAEPYDKLIDLFNADLDKASQKLNDMQIMEAQTKGVLVAIQNCITLNKPWFEFLTELGGSI